MRQERGESKTNLTAEIRATGAIIASASQSVTSGTLGNNTEAISSIARLAADGSDYARGAYEAFSSVVSSLQGRMIPEELLLQLNNISHQKVLRLVAEHPGSGNMLFNQVGDESFHLKDSLEILSSIGFIEPALPTDESSEAWALTSWGVRAFARLEAERIEQELKDKIKETQSKQV